MATCEGLRGCGAPITMLDNKGYVYCQAHGRMRRQSGTPCRDLAMWERDLISAGKAIPSYARSPRPKLASGSTPDVLPDKDALDNLAQYVLDESPLEADLAEVTLQILERTGRIVR
jgi:hypothetical protein